MVLQGQSEGAAQSSQSVCSPNAPEQTITASRGDGTPEGKALCLPQLVTPPIARITCWAINSLWVTDIVSFRWHSRNQDNFFSLVLTRKKGRP